MFIKLVTVILLAGFTNGERSQCEVTAARVALENQNTIVDTSLNRLVGSWLSEGCEIRPGPEYVLRSYSFRGDGTYRTIQHHYWDDSCSSPKVTIISAGNIRLKRDGLLNPDAALGFVKPVKITVIPQDTKAAKELDELVAAECPGQNWKSWRRHEEHIVFENTDYLNKPIRYNSQSILFSINTNNAVNSQTPSNTGDINCLGSLKWTFNELKLMKIQFRPILEDTFEDTKTSNVRVELLLGDMHSRFEHREHYIPTSFQTPLLKYVKEGEILVVDRRNFTVKNVCNICGNLYASDKSPPHLFEKPHLPPYIWGDWISVRCEMRPMGLYLTRKFTFHSDGSVWIGEHKFYLDPFCTIPKFIVTAAGRFILTSTNNYIEGSTNIDFKIEKASLTLYSKRMLHEMQMFKSCGTKHWQLGKSQELSDGCLQLGIVIPSVQNEIIKVEMNYEGACLLYLGQADTDNIPRSISNRPTAFQVPLIKCGEAEKYSESFGNLFDDTSYYDEISYSASSLIYLNNFILVLILMQFFYL